MVIHSNQKTKVKMSVLSHCISILPLNINGLNSPIKSHRVAGWMNEEDTTNCCLPETHLSSKSKQAQVKEYRMTL